MIALNSTSNSGSMQRVVVIGTSCSGKTTFSQALADRLGCKHVELDSIYWLKDWQHLSTDDFRAKVEDALDSDNWVVDGNYSPVRDIVWDKVTDVIWLNYSFPVVFGRAISRTFRRVIFREQMWAGNRETFRTSFLSRDSILLCLITTHHRKRLEYPIRFTYPRNTHLHITIFTSPRLASVYLQNI